MEENRSSKPVEDNGLTKREIILDAAFKLFMEKGYSNTKILDIAEEAGIGKGTVYEYFDSKDALFCEIFKKKVISAFSDVAGLLEECETNADKLKLTIEKEVENAKSFGGAKNVLPYIFSDEPMNRNREFMASIHDLMEMKFSRIQKIVEDGMAAGEFRRGDSLLYTVSLMGAINFYLAFNCNVIPEMSEDKTFKNKNWDADEFYRLLLNGLLLG